MPGLESPVYSFLEKPSMVDFEGHLSFVAFVSGCNFKCGFCHNAPLMAVKQKGITWERLDQVCDKLAENWVNGVVITGGEPTLSSDLGELIRFFKKYGWSVKLDTNGSKPGIVEQHLGVVDCIAMDVKAGLSGYPDLTGYRDVTNIESSINLIRASAVDYEFRTTVIEKFHTDEQMLEIGSMIQGAKKYYLQAFVPRDNLPLQIYRELSRTNPDRLQKIATLMKPYADKVIIRGEG